MLKTIFETFLLRRSVAGMQ